MKEPLEESCLKRDVLPEGQLCSTQVALASDLCAHGAVEYAITASMMWCGANAMLLHPFCISSLNTPSPMSLNKNRDN